MSFEPNSDISVSDPITAISGVGPATEEKLHDEYGVSNIIDLLHEQVGVVSEIDEAWKDDAKRDILSLNPSVKEAQVASEGLVDALLYKIATSGDFHDSDGNPLRNPLETGEYIDGVRNRANIVMVSPDSEIHALSSAFTEETNLFMELRKVKTSFTTYLFANADLRDIDAEELKFKSEVPFARISEIYIEEISYLFGIDLTQRRNLKYISLADRPDFPIKISHPEKSTSAIIAPRFSDDTELTTFGGKNTELEIEDYYSL